MSSQYIYLLQEREFIKTKENVYKVGMTEKENHKRFNQYPKGSILLFQIICKNCKNMEKNIIKQFKEKFKQRKDFGNEYFEGEYKNMIDIIYLTVKDEQYNEPESCENDKIYKMKMLYENIPSYIKVFFKEPDLFANKRFNATELYEITQQITKKYSLLSNYTATEFGLGLKKYFDKANGIKRRGNSCIYYDFPCKTELMRILFNVNKFPEDFSLDVEEQNIISNHNAEEEADEIYKITTYDEWRKSTNIEQIIVTKKGGDGFLRFKGQLWRNFYNKTRIDFDEDKMEDLLSFIENNQSKVKKVVSKKDEFAFIDVEYNNNEIMQDILNTCFVKSYEFYNLEYHEYVFPILYNNKLSSFTEYNIFNSLTFTFTPIDDLINNKILTHKDSGRRFIYVKKSINVDIVDDILDSLISPYIKSQYKKLVYNLIVKQNDKQIIFYDYNNCWLTMFIRDLLLSISNTKCVCSKDYYENKRTFKKILQTQNPRCVIIDNLNIKDEKQIEEFLKLGFKYIIVCKTDTTNNMYNVLNFKKYLNDNAEYIIKIIKEENSYEPSNLELELDNDIFYKSNLLQTNFLKWCCK